jgi:hypothetical protein
MGVSKFASAGPLDESWTKEQLVTALGLQGFSYASGEGPLYVVSVQPDPALIQQFSPMVPVVYKVGTPKAGAVVPADSKDSKALVNSLEWKTVDNFQKDSVSVSPFATECQRSMMMMCVRFGCQPAQIPGYTSGGLAEVVVRTVEVPAKDLKDLELKGVRLLTFNS